MFLNPKARIAASSVLDKIIEAMDSHDATKFGKKPDALAVSIEAKPKDNLPSSDDSQEGGDPLEKLLGDGDGAAETSEPGEGSPAEEEGDKEELLKKLLEQYSQLK